jgi:hypothetical protein
MRKDGSVDSRSEGDSLILALTLIRRLRARNKLYNLTEGDALFQLADKQVLKCAICRVKFHTESKLVLDHNHATGAARGFLCGKCNLLLGFAEDKITILDAAKTYLRVMEGSVDMDSESID